jgi:HK97 family phage major capsid protein
MPYGNLIDRSGAVALMPEDVSMKLIKEVTDASLAMTAFEDVQMVRGQTRTPVIAALCIAYFVGSDTGLAQTTQMDWKNKYINAETLEAIVPIPEAVVEDVDGDIWAQIEPKVKKAIARTLDGAVIFGMGAPETFPESLVGSAKSAGNEVKIGTADQAEGSLAHDVSVLVGKMEEDGFEFDYAAAYVGLKTKMRNARDTLGQKLTEFEGGTSTLLEQPLVFPARGMWPTGSGEASAILIEREQFVIGLRTDFDMKILDQAVISDAEGKIVFNLATQDMIGLRIRFRCGWQVSNQVTYDQPTESLRYPAGVLTHE